MVGPGGAKHALTEPLCRYADVIYARHQGENLT